MPLPLCPAASCDLQKGTPATLGAGSNKRLQLNFAGLTAPRCDERAQDSCAPSRAEEVPPRLLPERVAGDELPLAVLLLSQKSIFSGLRAVRWSPRGGSWAWYWGDMEGNGGLGEQGRGLGWEAATCPEPPIRQVGPVTPADGRWAPGRRGQAEAKATISYIPKRLHRARKAEAADKGRSAAPAVNREQTTRTDRSQAKQTAGQPGRQAGGGAGRQTAGCGCQSTQEEAGRPSDPRARQSLGRDAGGPPEAASAVGAPPRAQGGEEGRMW